LFGPTLSSTRRVVSRIAMMPIGRFSQKIHCQASPSAIAPPMNGPLSVANPVSPRYSPIALPRRAGGNTALISVSDSGSTIAAPTPCTARAVISAPMLGASAHATEPSVNTASPTVNTRRRPNRSPRAAPVSNSTANGRL
jgi:hypothetical protein